MVGHHIDVVLPLKLRIPRGGTRVRRHIVLAIAHQHFRGRGVVILRTGMHAAHKPHRIADNGNRHRGAGQRHIVLILRLGLQDDVVLAGRGVALDGNGERADPTGGGSLLSRPGVVTAQHGPGAFPDDVLAEHLVVQSVIQGVPDGDILTGLRLQIAPVGHHRIISRLDIDFLCRPRDNQRQGVRVLKDHVGVIRL